MKKLSIIFLLSTLLFSSSIENGIGIYFNGGIGKSKRDLNSEKSSNYSYGIGAIAYNVNENNFYIGIKAGGEFGKMDFDKKYDFNTLKIEGEFGYRFDLKEKIDGYFILGYKKMNLKLDLSSKNYTGIGYGFGIAKTIDSLFRSFADLTIYDLENNSLNDTIKDIRLNIGIIIKD